MKKILVLFVFSLILIGCNSGNKRTTKLSQLIPDNSIIILKISDLESFKSDIKNNDFVNTILKNEDDLFDSDLLNTIQTVNKVLYCVSEINNIKHTSIITKYNDSLLKTLTNSTSFYTKIIDSIYVVSTSESIINAINPKENLSFETLNKTTNDNASFSLFLNKKSSNSLGKAMVNNTKFTNALVLDTNLSSDEINLNGITTTDNSRLELLDIFHKNMPQENSLLNIVPNDSEGFLSFTFSDYDILKSNIETFSETKIDSTLNDFWLHTVNEIGEVYLDNSSVIILKSLDAATTQDGLIDHQEITSTFREIDVLEFTTPDFFNTILVL